MQWFKSHTRRLHPIGLALLTLLALTVSHLVAGEKDFSIVVLPDPQHYASKYTKVGQAQTAWIRDQAEKLRIAFVVTVGDNVDTGYVDKQFKRSDSWTS